MKNKSSNLNKTIDWNKWWNSFEKSELKRVQSKQEREDVFKPSEKEKLKSTLLAEEQLKAITFLLANLIDTKITDLKAIQKIKSKELYEKFFSLKN